MPHHEYVEDVLQEIHLNDTNEIENNKSYFVRAQYTYIYAKDRAFGSHNTYTAVYLYKDIGSVYQRIVCEPEYPYNLIVREFLGDILS